MNAPFGAGSPPSTQVHWATDNYAEAAENVGSAEYPTAVVEIAPPVPVPLYASSATVRGPDATVRRSRAPHNLSSALRGSAFMERNASGGSQGIGAARGRSLDTYQSGSGNVEQRSSGGSDAMDVILEEVRAIEAAGMDKHLQSMQAGAECARPAISAGAPGRHTGDPTAGTRAATHATHATHAGPAMVYSALPPSAAPGHLHVSGTGTGAVARPAQPMPRPQQGAQSHAAWSGHAPAPAALHPLQTAGGAGLASTPISQLGQAVSTSRHPRAPGPGLEVQAQMQPPWQSVAPRPQYPSVGPVAAAGSHLHAAVSVPVAAQGEQGGQPHKTTYMEEEQDNELLNPDLLAALDNLERQASVGAAETPLVLHTGAVVPESLPAIPRPQSTAPAPPSVQPYNATAVAATQAHALAAVAMATLPDLVPPARQGSAWPGRSGDGPHLTPGLLHQGQAQQQQPGQEGQELDSCPLDVDPEELDALLAGVESSTGASSAQTQAQPQGTSTGSEGRSTGLSSHATVNAHSSARGGPHATNMEGIEAARSTHELDVQLDEDMIDFAALDALDRGELYCAPQGAAPPAAALGTTHAEDQGEERQAVPGAPSAAAQVAHAANLDADAGLSDSQLNALLDGVDSAPAPAPPPVRYEHHVLPAADYIERSLSLTPEAIVRRLGAFADPDVTFPEADFQSDSVPSSQPYQRLPVFLRVLVSSVSHLHQVYQQVQPQNGTDTCTTSAGAGANAAPVLQRVITGWFLERSPSIQPFDIDGSHSLPAVARIKSVSVIVRSPWVQCEVEPCDVIHVVARGQGVQRGAVGAYNGDKRLQALCCDEVLQQQLAREVPLGTLPPWTTHGWEVTREATYQPQVYMLSDLHKRNGLLITAVDESSNALIVHPDMLVAPTKIPKGSDACVRRAVLDELLLGAGSTGEGGTTATLFGTLKHSLFEHGLTVVTRGVLRSAVMKQRSDAATGHGTTHVAASGEQLGDPRVILKGLLEAAALQLLRDPRTLEAMYAIGETDLSSAGAVQTQLPGQAQPGPSSGAAGHQTQGAALNATAARAEKLSVDKEAHAELLGSIPGVVDWLFRYCSPEFTLRSASDMAASAAPPVQVAGLYATEPQLWSPVWGLKGFLDAAILAQFQSAASVPMQRTGQQQPGYGYGPMQPDTAAQPFSAPAAFTAKSVHAVQPLPHATAGQRGAQRRATLRQHICPEYEISCLEDTDMQSQAPARLLPLPLELKSGKKPVMGGPGTPDHEAQILLYSLLLQERYGPMAGSSCSTRQGQSQGDEAHDAVEGNASGLLVYIASALEQDLASRGQPKPIPPARARKPNLDDLALPVMHHTRSVQSSWLAQQTLLVGRNNYTAALVRGKRSLLQLPRAWPPPPAAGTTRTNSSSSTAEDIESPPSFPKIEVSLWHCSKCYMFRACSALYSSRELPWALRHPEVAAHARPQTLQEIPADVRPMFAAVVQNMHPQLHVEGLPPRIGAVTGSSSSAGVSAAGTVAQYVDHWLRLVEMEDDAQNRERAAKGSLRAALQPVDHVTMRNSSQSSAGAGVKTGADARKFGIPVDGGPVDVTSIHGRAPIWLHASAERERTGVTAGRLVLVAQLSMAELSAPGPLESTSTSTSIKPATPTLHEAALGKGVSSTAAGKADKSTSETDISLTQPNDAVAQYLDLPCQSALVPSEHKGTNGTSGTHLGGSIEVPVSLTPKRLRMKADAAGGYDLEDADEAGFPGGAPHDEEDAVNVHGTSPADSLRSSQVPADAIPLLSASQDSLTAGAAAHTRSAGGAVMGQGFLYVLLTAEVWLAAGMDAARAARNEARRALRNEAQAQQTPAAAASAGGGGRSLLELDLAEGSWVSVSGDARGPYGLFSGAITRLTHSTMVIRGDRDIANAFPDGFAIPTTHSWSLPDLPSSSDGGRLQTPSRSSAAQVHAGAAGGSQRTRSLPFLWRVDTDESSTITRIIKDNIIKLATGRTISWPVVSAAGEEGANGFEKGTVDDEDRLQHQVDAFAVMQGASASAGLIDPIIARDCQGDVRRQGLLAHLRSPRFLPMPDLPWLPWQGRLHGLASNARLEPSDPMAHSLKATYEHVMNDEQRRAVDMVLSSRDWCCILGFPGVGKTSTLVTIIRCLIGTGRSVLITSHTHSAVDTLMTKLLCELQEEAEEDACGGASHPVSSRTGAMDRKAMTRQGTGGATSAAEFLSRVVRMGRLESIHPDVQPYSLEHAVASGRVSSLKQLHTYLTSAVVVGTTCLGMRHPLFDRHTFDVCIIDEASQIPEPIALGPLRCARVFCLVGDHYQLPPLVVSKQAEEGGMGTSLFKRMCEAHPSAVAAITKQYRMNEDIQLLSNSLIYNHRLRCGTAEVAQGRYTSIDMALLPAPTLHAKYHTAHIEQIERSRQAMTATPSLAGSASVGVGMALPGTAQHLQTPTSESPLVVDWLRRAMSPGSTVLFIDTDGCEWYEQAGSPAAMLSTDSTGGAMTWKALEVRPAAPADKSAVSGGHRPTQPSSSSLESGTATGAETEGARIEQALHAAMMSSPVRGMAGSQGAAPGSQSRRASGVGLPSASSNLARPEHEPAQRVVASQALFGQKMKRFSKNNSNPARIGGTMVNKCEASIVATLCQALLIGGAASTDVGVISPYRSQLKLIRRTIEEVCARTPAWLQAVGPPPDGQSSWPPACTDAESSYSWSQGVEVDTVDRYQGRDKRVIVMSLVRSNAEGDIGSLLADIRRLNVAFSRAKHKLILVGSRSTLVRGSSQLASLLSILDKRGWIVRLPETAHRDEWYPQPLGLAWRILNGDPCAPATENDALQQDLCGATGAGGVPAPRLNAVREAWWGSAATEGTAATQQHAEAEEEPLRMLQPHAGDSGDRAAGMGGTLPPAPTTGVTQAATQASAQAQPAAQPVPQPVAQPVVQPVVQGGIKRARSSSVCSAGSTSSSSSSSSGGESQQSGVKEAEGMAGAASASRATSSASGSRSNLSTTAPGPSMPKKASVQGVASASSVPGPFAPRPPMKRTWGPRRRPASSGLLPGFAIAPPVASRPAADDTEEEEGEQNEDE